MNETEFEKQLRSIAARMEYPHTPNIAGSVMQHLRPSTRPRLFSRTLVWSLTMLLILLTSLMLIPPARAAIIEFIQIGIVRIFPAPTESPAITTPESAAPVTATPAAQSSTLIKFLDQIAGETKLANAQEVVAYPLLLPTYPAELGLPDHVYVQNANGFMTILVWVDAQQPEHVTLSLHFIPQGSWMIEKVQPTLIQETEVNGQRAIWAAGPYPLLLRSGVMEFTRLIDGHVLIWTDGDITYRLETNLSLEEAVKIAESLQPIP
jgi:hypothetical protein